MPFKERRVKIKSKLLQRWGNLDEKVQGRVLAFVSKLLNYFLNSIVLALPILIVFSYFTKVGVKDYALIVVFLTLSLPFIEHYYVWFRESWRKEVELD